LLLLLSLLIALIQATIVGIEVASGATECVYTEIPTPNLKLGLYFSVQRGSGSDYDINYKIYDPLGEELFEDNNLLYQDLVFNGIRAGEYAVCFTNGASKTKLVDFELLAEDDPNRAHMPVKHPLDPEQQSAMEESMIRIAASLHQVDRDQEYFKQREHRSMSIVADTEQRIFWGALIMCGAVIAMAVGQAWVIRTFFDSGKKKAPTL